MRSAQVELLYGENGWVEVKDNGLVYGFDATKVMYSSGNVTERHRMATLQAEGDIVIDAYAGIGYYTMQLLVHANVGHVHACEINPNSIHALEWSANQNNVQSRLTVHPGDNQVTLRELKGTADRVLLGYLPSSEPTWEPAIQSLKETGGTLHIHMNVEEEGIDAWCEATMNKCLQFASKVWSELGSCFPSPREGEVVCSSNSSRRLGRVFLFDQFGFVNRGFFFGIVLDDYVANTKSDKDKQSSEDNGCSNT